MFSNATYVSIKQTKKSHCRNIKTQNIVCLRVKSVDKPSSHTVFWKSTFKKDIHIVKKQMNLVAARYGGASRWRVCYQRGLPRLVYKHPLYHEKKVPEIHRNTETENYKTKMQLLYLWTLLTWCFFLWGLESQSCNTTRLKLDIQLKPFAA